MIFYDCVLTAWGNVGIAWSENALVFLELPGFDEEELPRDIALELSSDTAPTRGMISDSSIAELRSLPARLQDYFTGAHVDFADVPVEEHGGPFQRSVRQALRSVGYGNSVTYGDLARMVDNPRASRAVGQAMACNRVPIVIPCHRVLGTAGRIGGFAYGAQVKARLLDLEGIPYK
jgi:methylated-DNA-[protein]-cysteine S-methyltransferase